VESVKENKQSSSRMSTDSDSQLTLTDLIPPKIHSDLPESKSLYDTPRSTRPSSVVDQGHYDSPRSTLSLYDVPPKSSQVSQLSLLAAQDLYDTPPPSRAVSILSASTFKPEDLSDNESVKSGISQKSDLHYSVNGSGGKKDIYSKPSLRLKPPELPPRNTPTNSKIFDEPVFPDYMDVEEEVEELESFQPNILTKHCQFCREALDKNSKLINSNGNLYHTRCFVCAQCFQPFKDGIFFEFEGRKYCKHDFQVLFASCCAKCSDFIVDGRVIKALGSTWHPQCLTCDRCDKPVSDIGFSKIGGKAVCKDCAAKYREEGNSGPICRKCSSRIDGDPLRFQGNIFHPYHFNCSGCGVELTSTAREVISRPGITANKLNELYCLRCHDKMNIPICGACRRPIEERVVTAMGKHWHIEHFACAKCEKPFLGHKHYEKNGQAYCYFHYHQLFGSLCYHCNGVIEVKAYF